MTRLLTVYRTAYANRALLKLALLGVGLLAMALGGAAPICTDPYYGSC